MESLTDDGLLFFFTSDENHSSLQCGSFLLQQVALCKPVIFCLTSGVVVEPPAGAAAGRGRVRPGGQLEHGGGSQLPADAAQRRDPAAGRHLR